MNQWRSLYYSRQILNVFTGAGVNATNFVPKFVWMFLLLRRDHLNNIKQLLKFKKWHQLLEPFDSVQTQVQGVLLYEGFYSHGMVYRQWRQFFKIDSIGPLNKQTKKNFCMVSLLQAIPRRLGSPMESGTVTIMAIRRYTRTYPPKAWVSTVAVSTSIWIVTTLAVGTTSTVQQKCTSRSARKSSLVRPVLHLADELSFDRD